MRLLRLPFFESCRCKSAADACPPTTFPRCKSSLAGKKSAPADGISPAGEALTCLWSKDEKWHSVVSYESSASGTPRRKIDDRDTTARSCSMSEESMKCLAVVKKSVDPRADFRRSMAEMVVEKRIYDAAELERLLDCFLSLNSSQHHVSIIAAFVDIWEALFPAAVATDLSVAARPQTTANDFR
ncbi:hypothetical protein KSP39_PZI015343 [Platanthera zijinensis]|uniref:Transcription repressor n=1 Tax=Platanthera zijinensis TaxID=2320716 RepID=A0AAP0B9K8_9ASPA